MNDLLASSVGHWLEMHSNVELLVSAGDSHINVSFYNTKTMAKWLYVNAYKDQTESDRKSTSSRPKVLLNFSIPVTIFLSDAAAHLEVEKAVEQLLESADIKVISRDKPKLGSWFRSIKAKAILPPGASRDISASALHAAESRLITAHEANITAIMMQNLPPLLGALQPTKDAVIRVGALLVVKIEWAVTSSPADRCSAI